ncbi:F-box/kelch-repeat protein At1g30090-like [Carya illinoinensis]|uniref:F-box/kelch-repeat protein At1g30090-like n=1 Tax=Carya illinoinensis TaxID=32201 RepID=UPI001C72670A|nr:F-box/kelch-repeat protein At1g30090-like [Carya illinoinensis]
MPCKAKVYPHGFRCISIPHEGVSFVWGGMIYVARGNSTHLFELDSAEVMDPVKGIWHPIALMGTNMASYDAAVLNGKLLVTEGWIGSSVVVFGHLFVVSDLERMKLKVYDVDTDSWETIEGPPLPEQICKPFTVSANDCRIYVVGRNLYVAVGSKYLKAQPKRHSQ